MNADKLDLTTVSKMFEYEKISRQLDACTNIDLLRNICKSYIKLYMKQEEVISTLGISK